VPRRWPAQAAGDEGARVAAAAARVAVAVSERDADLATGSTTAAEPLARLMLGCAARPEHSVLEWSMDYFLQVAGPLASGSFGRRAVPDFCCCLAACLGASPAARAHPALLVSCNICNRWRGLVWTRSRAAPPPSCRTRQRAAHREASRHAASQRPWHQQQHPCFAAHHPQVNTVPVEERHPFLRRDVYLELAPLLLAHAQYPPGFTAWEECIEQDEEAFYRWVAGPGAGPGGPAG
jgi:hypothetical protein